MPINLGLITSFCILDISTALRELRNSSSCKNYRLELYAFMEPDLPWLFGTIGKSTALEALTSDKASPEDIARKLHLLFAGFEISAISSFLPEISSNKSISDVAQTALIFLVHVISELRHLGHPVRTLELVAGSATNGVCITNANDELILGKRVFSVTRVETRVACLSLLQKTARLAKEASDADVDLAWELEPGPLFTLSNLKTMRTFAEVLSEKGTTYQKNKFGFNLDIPHWAFLAGITIDELRREENSQVAKRIVHAHISEHSKGHFCDKVPEEVSERMLEYRDWIEFLRELGEAPRDGSLQFSGVMSIELECCRSLEEVEYSLAYFSRLLPENYDAGAIGA